MERLSETDSTMEERFGKCPYATAQSLISGKWSILIMHYLENGPIRFNDLLRLMPKMTHATLSVQLKTLADHGLLEDFYIVTPQFDKFAAYCDDGGCLVFYKK